MKCAYSTATHGDRINLIVSHQKITLKTEEAETILKSYQRGADGLYNPRNLPFMTLASMQSPHTSIQWAGSNHSADFAELAMFGPGSETLAGYVKNFELHNFMLQACGVEKSLFA